MFLSPPQKAASSEPATTPAPIISPAATPIITTATQTQAKKDAVVSVAAKSAMPQPTATTPKITPQQPTASTPETPPTTLKTVLSYISSTISSWFNWLTGR